MKNLTAGVKSVGALHHQIVADNAGAPFGFGSGFRVRLRSGLLATPSAFRLPPRSIRFRIRLTKSRQCHVDASGMDMGPGAGAGAGTRMHPGSGNSENRMTPRELVNGKPGHLMSRMELVTDRVEQTTRRNPRTDATPAPSPAPSNDLLYCIHGLCSQVSALASPPSAGGFQPGPHSISIDVSVLINRSTGPLPSHLTGLRVSAIGTAPPKIPAADRLLTPLRI